MVRLQKHGFDRRTSQLHDDCKVFAHRRTGAARFGKGMRAIDHAELPKLTAGRKRHARVVIG
jgi:hypothetical protein